ncbi:NUDIX hydrolase [Pontibacillus marinus]|uniref:DNA mismatch repair protein MutT n=1 Tax=Pontibacillus marinus BH030004 = DSM 16465 TaxID=1385511 RepID=A0A0A5G054_9BACI|nr:NUDIX domain-containing protein [Pontibacillus marinus]KGX84445.1 DNA mismatch repair protein MutT [Pontibacillus marinus BH030004 = DSM 16465]
MFIVNVEGAIHKDGKWLFIRRSEKEEHAGGMLSFIGGKVDDEGNKANVLEETLHREIDEEVGVKVKNLQYVNSSSFVTDKGKSVVDIVFYCEYESGEPHVKSLDEVEGVFWLTSEELEKKESVPDFLIENLKQAELVKSSLVTN